MNEVDSRSKRGVILDYVTLAAPSFSGPMLLWAQSYVGVGHPERLLLIGIVVWVIAALALVLLRRLGVGRIMSLLGVWAGTYVFMRIGDFVDTYGLVAGTAIVTALFAISLFLISRRATAGLLVLVHLASGLLVVEVALAWFGSMSSYGEDVSVTIPAPLDVSLGEKPDIVLVVADALIGGDGLERFFGVDEPGIVARLEGFGFEVPERAFSPYPTTRAAIPAMLEMGYPLEAGPGINPATTQNLYDRISGDNRLMDVLIDNGYRIAMNESGWSGSMCGERIDDCVVSPWLDESVFNVLKSTWLGEMVLDRWGYSFTAGALHGMDWLESNLGPITSDSTPDFVLAHLEIPHPPFFLNSDCELDPSRDRTGVTLQWPGVPVEYRKQVYLEQVDCLEGFLARVLDEVSEDTIVVIAGDHGPDSQHQLVVHPEEWSEDETAERLNVMLAHRGPDGCELSDPIVLSQVFAQILACMSDDEVPEVEQRLFRYGIHEVDGKPSPIVELSTEERRRLLES